VPQKIDDFGANSQGQLAGLKTCRRSLAQAGKRGGGGENWRQKGDFMRHSSFASYLYTSFFSHAPDKEGVMCTVTFFLDIHALYGPKDQRQNLSDLDPIELGESFFRTIQEQAKNIACLISQDRLIGSPEKGWQLNTDSTPTLKGEEYLLEIENHVHRRY
jgi:hypothetical protein